MSVDLQNDVGNVDIGLTRPEFAKILTFYNQNLIDWVDGIFTHFD